MTTLVEELEQAADDIEDLSHVPDARSARAALRLRADHLRQRAAWVRDVVGGVTDDPNLARIRGWDRGTVLGLTGPDIPALTGPIPSETAPDPMKITNHEAMAFCVFRALGCSREDAVRTVNEMIGAAPALAKLAGRRWTGKASPSDMLWIEILRRDASGGATAGEAKPACICPFPRLYCPMSCSNHACPACEGEKRRAAIAELKARP